MPPGFAGTRLRENFRAGGRDGAFHGAVGVAAIDDGRFDNTSAPSQSVNERYSRYSKGQDDGQFDRASPKKETPWLLRGDRLIHRDHLASGC
jgi:hypothetical protein